MKGQCVMTSKKNKNLVAKDELQPYDILPNYEGQLIVKLLEVAKANGAPINDETIKNISKHLIKKGEE